MADNASSIALDSLALIASAERGDKASYEAMMSTFTGPGDDKEYERGQLVGWLVAHSVAILRCASESSGIAADKILGGVAASLRGDLS